MTQEASTESKILKAAEDIFIRDGIDGARMQEIADTAGINKAMLHYYFRSKKLLFDKVFTEKAKYFFPEVSNIFMSDSSMIEKLDAFVEKYILFMNENPYIPFFIISTVNKRGNEEFIDKLPFKETIAKNFMESYAHDLELGRVQKVDPMQLLLSVLGMCIFPYLSKPILTHNFGGDDDFFKEFMLARIVEVKAYLRKILIVD
ncbi:TetR/AcrR family transcriptional regulator [uncultured Arcticibacterium sp.]|uniref:TetR/AcrR family transcriptional regulator n=1 Tax=uncultured Arcticibacterium sp. TaxID=2173042 RepID=UPI0030F5DD4D